MDEKMIEQIERVRSLLEQRFPDGPPLAFVHTYGCQQNVSDGEKFKGMLAQMGYGFCDSPERADLVLFNTCAVRENAEARVFGNVGALKNAKRQNPKMRICLCGCMIQQPHIAQKLRESYPYVDLAFGAQAQREFPALLYRMLTGQKRVVDLAVYDRDIPEGLPTARDCGYKSWLPIMYGCDNFCTYCIVPYVRGRERSRASADILREFTSLVESGCREITLLGQNVNSYGKGLAEEIDFARLLRRLNAVPGDFRIRFMTSHPKDASFALIDAIADCEKAAKHFHLPVQSGSDRILRLMNRQYSTADYLRLVDYARRRIPQIAFTTDIIVGFPGETEADFEATLALLRRVEYDNIFSFIYSKRVGTRAAELPDPTPRAVKTARFAQMLELQKEISFSRNRRMVGRVERILADGEGKSPGRLCGRTETNLIVDFAGGPELLGRFVDVKITAASNWALAGEQI